MKMLVAAWPPDPISCPLDKGHKLAHGPHGRICFTDGNTDAHLGGRNQSYVVTA